MFANLRTKLAVFLAAAVIVVLGISTVSAKTHPAINIAELNVDSRIVEFPIVGDTWAISPWERHVGHLEATGWFDAPGNVVLAGHSVMPDGKAGVFANLASLAVGDTFSLFDGEVERQYQVSEVLVVSEYDLSVVYPTNDERVTLITCEVNSFDEATQTYSNRLVVVATRLS